MQAVPTPDSPGPLCPPRQVPWLKQSRSPLSPHARSRPGLCHLYKVSCGCWPTSQGSPVCENALSSVDRPLRGSHGLGQAAPSGAQRIPGVQVYRTSVSPNKDRKEGPEHIQQRRNFKTHVGGRDPVWCERLKGQGRVVRSP